jgi:phage-related protein (TIGR01555 family)
LSDIILQFGQQISGACGIPLVRLFGQSPAGLNSSGDSDIRNYYDHINSLQNANLRTCITKLLNVIYPSTFGEQAPEDLQFDFTPLWQMSALDKATIAKTTTESIIGALDSGVIDTATAMKELRLASRDTGLFTNISDEQIAQAEEELPMPDAEASVEEQAVIKDSFTTESTKRKFNIVPKWLKK